ncbi:Fc.00g026750.m01.CDS01 [Cosmosporella sp. VM-42]
MSPEHSPEPQETANATNGIKKPRAKHACRECNTRRVRCNVTEVNPCTNCQTTGAKCEVLPSRRGRYPRRARRQKQHAQAASISESHVTGTDDANVLSSIYSTHSVNSVHSIHDIDLVISPQNRGDAPRGGIPARTPSPSNDSAAPGTLFFGESNFLTLVPGRVRPGEEPNHNFRADGSKQKARLLFPITSTPQSLLEGVSPASIDHLSAGTSRYLRDEGALTLPDLQTCIPALQAYFDWFHPCFPVLDRGDFIQKLAGLDVSYLLLQAVLFIGTTYCDHTTITSMGFKDRSEAKSLLYTRARLLFHADWEKDEITLIQSLFLMSFWRGGPSDVRDVRYWLGVVIGVAESYGLHRSARFTTRDPHKARLRRRIWWSIYVRERQAAASLGLPSRIRDDDCDIEPLSPSDLESEGEHVASSLFGSCKPEHITYAIKMVEIARILGRVIDVHFAPGRPQSTPEQVRNLDNALDAWKKSLPDEVSDGVDDGNVSVWSHLLHLAYNHLRILIYRHNFLREVEGDKKGQMAVAGASKISRIAEDMLAQGTLRYGQMHLITSLFAALCIHAISIRRGVDITRRIAEHRAQMCLLGLQEIQKYWRINNNVLDLFLQYLDVSIAKRLHGAVQTEATLQNMADLDPQILPGEQARESDSSPAEGKRYDVPTPQTQAQTKSFEDQYFNMLYGPWEGDDGMADLGLVLQADDPMQMEGLNFLGRSL